MIKDSTIDCLTAGSSRSAVSPRLSTLAVIRQFSRAYVSVTGMQFNKLICN